MNVTDITTPGGLSLFGRQQELATIAHALDEGRRGRSTTLLVTGEPGAGKSALLRAATASADGMRVVTASGIDAESELGFAVLADVLRPLSEHIATLVPHQQAVILGVMGHGPPTPADPLGTSAAAVALLAAAAEVEPLLVVVDDFHWLDVSSQIGLVYIARRLGPERVVLLIGTREIPPPLAHAGIAELRLGKLGDTDARNLLRAHVPSISPKATDAIVATADGNPLALVELTSFLAPDQLDGRAPLPSPLPVNGPVETAFRERLESLSAGGRRAVVVAAIEDAGDPGVVRRACEALGIADGLDEAEISGALTLGPPLRFRHPILRSLAHQLASDRERRETHGALAAVLDPTDAYRRAWHAARATLGPDEDVAQALDAAAVDVRMRQQFSSAAAASVEAARLSATPDARARRLVLAAADHQLSGDFGSSEECLSDALRATGDVALRAEAQRVRGQGMFVQGRWSDAVTLLEREGEQLADALPDVSAALLTQAAMACQPLGRIEQGLRTGRRAVEVAERASPATQFFAQLVYAELLALRGEAALVAELMAGARTIAPLDDPRVAGMALQSEAGYLMVLGEHAEARSRIELVIAAARDAGAAGILPYPLGLLGEVEFRSGRWPQALSAASEGAEIAQQTGQAAWGTFALQVLVRIHAAMGRFEDAELAAVQAESIASSLGIEGMRFYLPTARAFLGLTAGDLESAVDHGRDVEEISRERGLREPAVVLWAPDLVEAYSRLGRVGEAHAVLERFRGEAEATGRVWALAAAARCRGLLNDDFESEFDQALDHHHQLDMPFERARSELCLGERRRRGGRRSDARPPLRSALHTFERLGAQPWAERARAELGASGERVRPRDAAPSDELTPHELRVALIVARGATNREAAAELFVSPKTVDYHLRHVYRKLGIRSRAELGRLLANEALPERC